MEQRPELCGEVCLRHRLPRNRDEAMERPEAASLVVSRVRAKVCKPREGRRCGGGEIQAEGIQGTDHVKPYSSSDISARRKGKECWEEKLMI